MYTPKWISWAGFAAIAGGLLALVLTLPISSANDFAYPEDGMSPFWAKAFRPLLGSLLTFASPIEVYNIYGRLYDFVYLLFLPATFGMHSLHREIGSRLERVGFVILVVGLLVTFVGVAGDYWANGVTFVISLFGLLLLIIGTPLYGVAVVRAKVLPVWFGWLLVSCLPGALIFLMVIWHLPSGPTVPLAIAWLILGYMLVVKKGIQSEQQAVWRSP